MLSIFYITPKNITEILNKDDISKQIDEILPRFKIIDQISFWQDNNNQNSIFITSGESEIIEIGVRFDTSELDSTFIEKVKDFVEKNNLSFLIRQEIHFSSESLTKELIFQNINRVKFIENPIEFIKKQE